MLGNFFWRSTDQKQVVNKKQSFATCASKEQNVEIYSPTSSGGQKYIICVNFCWPLLEADL